MTADSKTWRLILTESAIAFALFVAAAYAAGHLQEMLTPNILGAYIFWFAFSMTPFFLFGRSRGVFRFDRWDAIASCPILIMIAIVASVSFHFRHVHPIWMCLVPVSAVLFGPIFNFTRSRLPSVAS
ncbi:hypothetical protein [Rubripirellula obstinata]|nr:hypothetical protein [Rubripirellula obstinata]